MSNKQHDEKNDQGSTFRVCKKWLKEMSELFFLERISIWILPKKVEFFRLAHVISVYFLTATITADSDILLSHILSKVETDELFYIFLVLTFRKIEILRVHFYQLEIYFAKKCIIEKTWKKWIKKIYQTPKIHRLILIIYEEN